MKKSKTQKTANLDPQDLAKCKILNGEGKQIPMGELWREKSCVFIFLRHFACLACRAHAIEVWKERSVLKKARIVFIGNGDPYFIESFREELGLKNAEIFTDPSRKVFEICGFERGIWKTIGPSAIAKGMKLLSRGYRQGPMAKGIGDYWQLGGVLVVGPGNHLKYVYRSAATGDFPSTGEIAATL